MSVHARILLRARVALILLPLVIVAAGCTQPFNVYLTWQGDTGTTMTVNFHTEGPGIPEVYYDVVSRHGNIGAYSFTEQGTSHQIPGLEDERYIHTVELTNLEPGTTYYFVGGLAGGGFATSTVTLERRFRTIPNDGEAIRFITGGDMDLTSEERELLELAKLEDPMMGLIGGDIAYVNGDLDDYEDWDEWLQRWDSIMVTSEGHMVPLVLAIGNHEVDGGFDQGPEDAPFYLGYFPQANGSTFFSRTFGTNLVIYVLDSNHAAPHGGDQAEWLEDAMAEHAGYTHQFAVYHVPLYPSARNYENERSEAGRIAWGPIFDTYGLDTAFENHDHMLKRTKRMKDGEVDATGTLYLGDGCFGKAPRETNEDNLWYMDVVKEERHFWVVEVDGNVVTYTAINIDGDVIDQHTTEEKAVN